MKSAKDIEAEKMKKAKERIDSIVDSIMTEHKEIIEKGLRDEGIEEDDMPVALALYREQLEAMTIEKIGSWIKKATKLTP